jgi:hypothetical protein
MNDMKNFHDMFFGPLGKEWCLYYYILLVFAFIGLVMTIFSAVVSLVNAKKLTMSGFLKNSIVPVITSTILYFLARMIYSICINALH